MAKVALIALLLATMAPITSYAGSSVSCTVNSNGTVSCTYTHTW